MTVIGVIGILVGILMFKWIESGYTKRNGKFEKEWVNACVTKSGVVIGFVLFEKVTWLKSLMFKQKNLMKKIQQAYGKKNLEKRRDFFVADQLAVGVIIFWIGMCVIVGTIGRFMEKEDYAKDLIKPYLSEFSKSDGETNKKLYYQYLFEDIKKDGEVQIALLPYVESKKDLQDYMTSQLENLSRTFLGQNKSVNAIEYNLKLPKSDSTGLIHFSYQSSNQEVVTDFGELRRMNPMIFGEKLSFKMIASGRWQDETIQVEKILPLQIVRVFSNNKVMQEWIQQQVDINIETQNKDQKLPAIKLPTIMDGVKGLLIWKRPSALPKLLTGICFVMVISVGIMLLKQYELTELRNVRERQIQNEFPDFVQKLLLLLYTGMNISQALTRMSQGSEVREKRILYGALQESIQAIQSGCSEMEALEDFGKKIGTKEFSRLISTLLQGIRKGNGTMMTQIEILGKESWDQRIINARQLGEKASSKLILPMGLILIAIIIMVVTPAWVSIQI